MNYSQKINVLISNRTQQYFPGQISVQVGKCMSIQQYLRQQPVEQEQLLQNLRIRILGINALATLCWFPLGLRICSLLGGVQ